MALKQYRTEYSGEYVITNTVFKGGRKEQTREWIENPINVTTSNHRACCIVPSQNPSPIPMVRIEQHRGDLLGRNRMQLYAIEEVWEEMNADFLIVMGQERLDEIKVNKYQVDHVVYTSAGLCIKNPGDFYLLPMGVMMLPPALVIWLACFDGHKDIYLYGYEQTDVTGKVQIKLLAQIQDIMKTYSDVTFHHVTNNATHDLWRQCINCRTLSTREFITECDI